MRAEHAPEERLVAPISWATLSVHVVASPGSYGASEVGGLSAATRQPGGLCDLPVKHGVVVGVLTVPGSRVEHVLVPRATIGPPPLESHWNHHWNQSHLP